MLRSKAGRTGEDRTNTRTHVTRACNAVRCIAGCARAISALALVWLALPTPCHANRFGPPWQARVATDQALVYNAPDRASVVVGPVAPGQVVVVVGEATATDGTEWTQSTVGYPPSADVVEDMTPWVAEVAVPSVSIYARPSMAEPIRRTASEGESPGCINVTWGDGAYPFNLTEPRVAPDLLARWAINVPATPVVIVD